MSYLASIYTTGYRKLIVYQKSRELIFLVYQAMSRLPEEEKYVLSSQMRRAVISIAANIVEGYSKSSKKEFIRFLDISIGSAAELELYLEVCLELKFIVKMEFDKINKVLTEVKKLLYSYQKSLKSK